GEQQRVAIARALLNDPVIILADEPTGNLDCKTSDGILALFDQLYREGQTIILVTHEESVARHTKRIIRMRDGKIQSDEPTRKGGESC
ncbi:MAG: ATP-binding cassette domain-containing protein, partial [Sedimentisphaerales bacterium]|nr:ATP-binding cassette domain-containing protein [Sedimentisphaerales bacterium]